MPERLVPPGTELQTVRAGALLDLVLACEREIDSLSEPRDDKSQDRFERLTMLRDEAITALMDMEVERPPRKWLLEDGMAPSRSIS